MNTKGVLVGHDIISLLRQREVLHNISSTLKERLHVTRSFISRLRLEKELEGHTGCVNCLEWNESGQILASASDDLHVILWDPFAHKQLQCIHTGHHGNIFSVKFMPQSNDNVLVTGAGDCRIRVHDVQAKETTYTCSCHVGRVKRIATAPNVPYMFWSAGEDGTVTQFDLRCPHSCSKEADNVLVNLMGYLGRYAEAKCLSINPRRPELLAVGANDPYVRLYDRRMLKLSCLASTYYLHPANMDSPELKAPPKLPPGCVQYYVAGHLPLREGDLKKSYRTFASTYLTFSSDGNELLVNLGGEQIYLFDINNKRRPKSFNVEVSNGMSSNGFRPIKVGGNGRVDDSPIVVTLTGQAEVLKTKANEAFERNKFTLAISLYNMALELSPQSALLYGNRAAAYMKRGWDGDMYAAMRDCLDTIKRDAEHWKAHLRLARCLFDLNWIGDANKCLKFFKARFSQYSRDRFCVLLEKELRSAAEQSTTEPPEKDTDDESSSTEGDQQSSLKATSAEEMQCREAAYDYEVRFCGHCNTTTDIKECNFFGSESQFVVAGSDDGSFFVWDRQTTNIVRILKGDESIVNCLQPHPTYCMLATSGIDQVVRIWSPGPEDGSKNDREVLDLDNAALANQKRMNADPFEVMLLNMGMPLAGSSGDDSSGETPIQCRPS